jgi:hypothetical protein
MEGLRRRLAGLFLAFCESPQANPEAAGARPRAGAPVAPGALAAPEAYMYAEPEERGRALPRTGASAAAARTAC